MPFPHKGSTRLADPRVLPGEEFDLDQGTGIFMKYGYAHFRAAFGLP
jgi:hypothetical protein